MVNLIHHIRRPYALSWKPYQGDSFNLPDHRGTGLWDCNKVFDSDGFMSCNSVNYGFLSITLGKCLKKGYAKWGYMDVSCKSLYGPRWFPIWSGFLSNTYSSRDRYRVVLNVTYYMIIFAFHGSISSGSWYKLWLDVELVKQSSSAEFLVALKVGSQLSMFKICAKICFDGMVMKS
nr:hypothetical protein [Tanacetum cinerariifolium]